MRRRKYNCTQLENLQTFLDDTSGSEMNESLKQHLYSPSPCLECRKFYDEYMEFKKILSSAAELEVPGPAVAAGGRFRGHSFRIGVLVSAAALAVFIGSFYTIRSISRSRVIAADTKVYVDELLDTPFLKTSDDSSAIPEDWFNFSVTDSL